MDIGIHVRLGSDGLLIALSISFNVPNTVEADLNNQCLSMKSFGDREASSVHRSFFGNGCAITLLTHYAERDLHQGTQSLRRRREGVMCEE